MYTPIRGKAIKKIVSPVQKSDLNLGNGIDSVMKLVGELTFLKQQLIQTMDYKMEEIDNAIAHAMDIQKGEKGDPGMDADEQKIANWVMSQIRIPKDGISPDPEEIVKEVVSRLPKLPNEKEFIAKIIKLIPENKPSLKVIQESIDKEALIEELLKSPKFKLDIGKVDGLKMSLDALDRRYIHGGGDTVSAGSGISIVNVNGTKQINATGSGSFTVLTATGAVDDSNVTFTFTSTPTLININGSFYSSTSTVGGTLVWTIAGLTVTLAFPVGTGGSIFAIA